MDENKGKKFAYVDRIKGCVCVKAGGKVIATYPYKGGYRQARRVLAKVLGSEEHGSAKS